VTDNFKGDQEHSGMPRRAHRTGLTRRPLGYGAAMPFGARAPDNRMGEFRETSKTRNRERTPRAARHSQSYFDAFPLLLGLPYDFSLQKFSADCSET
jgi:hypothetical protein